MSIVNEVQPERLYEKFNDLGEYRIKRFQKRNDLDFFKIDHKKKKMEDKKVYSGVK